MIYPRPDRLPALQPLIGACATARALVQRELGRVTDYTSPTDTAEAAMVDIAEQGGHAEDMLAWLQAGEEWAAKHPPYPQVHHPLVGPIRIVAGVEGKLGFGDDTGPKTLVGCSNFCALRDLHDNLQYDGTPLWEHDLNLAVANDYQYTRTFRVLGFDGKGVGPDLVDGGWFKGRGVSPWWGPDALITYAGGCKVRGMRIQLSCGHQGWTYAERMAWERMVLEKIHAAGLDQVFWWIDGDNEYWQNAEGRNSDEQIAFYHQWRDMGRGILDPAPFFVCGAPEDESPANALRASMGGVVELHTSRDPDKLIKRPFSVWYQEGHIGALRLAVCFGEPAPFAGGPGDFAPTDSPGRQFAMLAMGAIIGGATTYFDGWDVASSEPLDVDAPTFRTAALWIHAIIPDDIVSWEHVPGGRFYWWRKPRTKQFITVFDELWGGWDQPPLPIAEWTAYGPGNAVHGPNTGPITLPAGFGGAVVVGTFQ